MSGDAPVGATQPLPPSGGPGRTSRLLSEEPYYTDEELIKAQRSRVLELERRARELEGQLLAAQSRLATLEERARARSAEVENEQIAALVPWAKEESVAIVQDARQRAAELGVGTETSPELEDLGRLLLSHFELQERLVHVIRAAALEDRTSNPSLS